MVYVEIAAGLAHAMARRSDGMVVVWGNPNFGLLLVPPLPPGQNYAAIAAGDRHCLALRDDGWIAAWGSNDVGECWVPALPPGVVYERIDAGDRFSLALRSDGSVVAWGANNYGQCNVPPRPPGLAFVEIAAGAHHAMGRLSDGTVLAWGGNIYGQCDVPPLAPGVVYLELDAGEDFSLARRSDGSVAAWGDDSWFQLKVPALPAQTLSAGISGGGDMGSLLYLRDCPAAEIYCTSKANSLGCHPAIGLNAAPSASAGTGSQLTASSLLGNSLGLFIHSAVGADALPLHGGWLCVRSPVRRHPAQMTQGSTGTCTGALSEDLNAYIASGADPALFAGAVVWVQAWSRDPGDPFGDSLSDAITATIAP